MQNCVRLFVLHISFLCCYSSCVSCFNDPIFTTVRQGLIDFILWEFVTIFRSQIAVIVLILDLFFCFFIHSLIKADLKPKPTWFIWGLYSYSVICVGLIHCACSWRSYSYSLICVGLIFCACSWGLYSYTAICVGPIYCTCSWRSYSYSVICVGLIYCACSWCLYSYTAVCVGLIYHACSWGSYNHSVICVRMINCTVLLLSLKSVFFYTTQNGKSLCKLIQIRVTDLSTELWFWYSNN
jgi:hypothetical protein